MCQFILNMWILRKADEVYVRACATKGYIKEQEADIILATPQMTMQQ
ncbi:hypothetical protein [Bacillus thuringiensis]|nr:hypothetical protein [Bacillus thuringiensis]MCU5028587.1 hypothetical protein [Bacillus cereus]MRA71917.1 hypothetical protein [Bacillus thuringiensis]MRA91199.1 hypothetical protein [Bacillus thuringiensis]MRC53416.1 hypothetical protein [Bacillus thuringiensis]